MGRWVLWVAIAVLCGCGAKKSETSASAAEPPAQKYEPPPIPTDGAIGQLGMGGPEDKPWDEMNAEEKEWYMIGKVHPVMRQVFQTYDHDRYEGLKFECTPCHAENGKETHWKMPNNDLSPIPPLDSQEYKDMQKSKLVIFMSQRVVPVMASLLGEEPYNAETGEGFSCYGCHPHE